MMYKKLLNTQSSNLKQTMFYGPLFVGILASIMILMSLVVALQSCCLKKDCLAIIVSCTTNNGAFGCSTTVITAFLFFYLLLFVEALNETSSDVDFMENELTRVNKCLWPNDQINIEKI